ncbi:hypothetical protein LOZ65_001500 [Ophidiomyces ophidiicola]|nr:hypothetical protein LOZ65_001500 [Ophidiomyces ophidiicola]
MPNVAKDRKARMEAAGSVDVVEIICKWPQNQWPRDREMKEIGIWTMVNTQQGMQALSLAALTRGLGWTPEEAEALLIDLRKDVRDASVHIYWPMSAIISGGFPK